MIQWIPLVFILRVLLLVLYFIHKSLKYKIDRERDAINKGFIAYLLTDSLLISWLVYRKNNPKDHL